MSMLMVFNFQKIKECEWLPESLLKFAPNTASALIQVIGYPAVSDHISD
jgi:hypothetical protein